MMERLMNTVSIEYNKQKCYKTNSIHYKEINQVPSNNSTNIIKNKKNKINKNNI